MPWKWHGDLRCLKCGKGAWGYLGGILDVSGTWPGGAFGLSFGALMMSWACGLEVVMGIPWGVMGVLWGYLGVALEVAWGWHGSAFGVIGAF